METVKFEKERIRNKELYDKIMTPHEASLIIEDGMIIGVSGFTPSGYPKVVPLALAKRVEESGEDLKVTLYSGASLGPEIDEAWTAAKIIKKRLPYQTTTLLRNEINAGRIEYLDQHLSHVAQYVNYKMIPSPHVVIVEAVAITEDGDIIPTLGVGATPTFIKNTEKVIVEINMAKSLDYEGMADIYMPENPPNREPIPITYPGQRIGRSSIKCGVDKIAAIVFTNDQDKTRPFGEIDETSKKISKNLIDFLKKEVEDGKLPKNLYPIQSGVGNIANAVLNGLVDSHFTGLTFYTEVVQDSMLDLLRTGKASIASTTAISPSPSGLVEFEKELDFFKDKIIMRPQEISNNPEIIRRLGVISMNTALEMDIYGNVNSTHIVGSKMMNGIGGSGDFARNAFLTIFFTESIAMNGNISTIVPFVSHVDHTEHDVMILVTEQGYADLRGLSPKERAVEIIEKCAHPKYKDALKDYFNRAKLESANHTPHILSEAFSWHVNFINTGKML